MYHPTKVYKGNYLFFLESINISDDSFGLNELLKKTTDNDIQEEELSDPIFPPGFTPIEANCNDQNEGGNLSINVNTDPIKAQGDEGRREKFIQVDIKLDGSSDNHEVMKTNIESKQDFVHEGSGESHSLFTDSIARPKTLLDGFSMIDKFNDISMAAQRYGDRDHDLTNVCGKFGYVADVFIAKKLSKLGKRLAFVRYIKVKVVSHIINGLHSTWIRYYKIYANMARFDRKVEDKSTIHSRYEASGPIDGVNGRPNTSMTYANVIQRKNASVNEPQQHKDHVIMLDGDCLKDIETSVTIFACVKEFRALMNMQTICKNEGFDNIILKYLGGFWIAVEFQSISSCEKFQNHAGIKSWFSSIRKASKDFFIRDRVAWIDVEGIHLQAWTHQAFTKIASKWGELIYTVDSKGSNMYSVRLCIKTNIDTLIAESFKIDVRGNIVMVRAKEITRWVLEFLEDKSRIEIQGKDDVEGPFDSDSDVEIKNGNEDKYSEEERVEDSYCKVTSPHEDSNHISDDPFGLDEPLKKTTNNDIQEEELSDPIFPPGFTPIEANCNDQNEGGNLSINVNMDPIKA
ncbi:hypothetical protein CTI12_AA048880 [Artemisia annua]|uniref:DUF4283 domain-containing protein n=1 Tax=Artemisia annua TaxID=35608 RepID=A0A2U1QBK9_ARTAN|nr:hypothetical protein CTI12_AA048880 [Artemisia annua]